MFFCFLPIVEIPFIVPFLIKENIRYYIDQKLTHLSDNHFSNFISAFKYQLTCEECNSDTFVEGFGFVPWLWYTSNDQKFFYAYWIKYKIPKGDTAIIQKFL